jgi:hypothetical protein
MGKRSLLVALLLAAFLVAVAAPAGIGRRITPSVGASAGARTPLGPAPGVDLTCSLALVKFDPNLINVAYPDQAALYFTVPYAGATGTQIEVDGLYPHARYMSFTVYDPAERPLDAINDVHISPAGGSANPFIAGARRDSGVARRHYTVLVQFGAKPATPAPNTIYTGTGENGPNLNGTLIYRIYMPDTQRDDTGGVGLPSVTLEPAGARTQTPTSSPCANTSLPTSGLSLNQTIATTNGEPALETNGSTYGQDPPRWSKFVNVAYSLVQTSTGSPAAQSVLAPLDGPLYSAALSAGGKGGFLSNLDNAYVAALINRGYGQVLVTRMRVATFADTRAGEPVMPAPQMRYWSMCENDPFTERYVACDADDQTTQSPGGFATYVVSTPPQRPANATRACGVNWIPWGPDARGLLILRNMLPAASFTQSIQNATLGKEAATMGGFYPSSRYFTTSAFAALGCARAATSVTPARSPALGCPAATGGLSATTLGAAKLGMTRARARRVFRHRSSRGRRSMVFFCLKGSGIRVGYPSPRLLRSLSRGLRREVAGKVVLALTSNLHYALNGVRPGARLASVARRLRLARGYKVGANTWYLARRGPGLGVLKVARGVIGEIGIANPQLLSTRLAARRFLSSFD